MRIAVCGDDCEIRKDLYRLIKKQAQEADIVEYQSGEEMIKAGGLFDISFLDIEMGEVSGMDIARSIRKQEESTHRSISFFEGKVCEKGCFDNMVCKLFFYSDCSGCYIG